MLSVAGDAARLVDAIKAVAYYQHSLNLIESTQVRSALADVLIAAGKLDHARGVLDAGSDALPLVVRRLIVATRSGEASRYAREISAADHRFRQWIAEADWLHAREMARFYNRRPRPPGPSRDAWQQSTSACSGNTKTCCWHSARGQADMRRIILAIALLLVTYPATAIEPFAVGDLRFPAVQSRLSF